MSDEVECEECKPGAPAWVMTFADLMSLLMCFFVLLLAFSEMDVEKFKQLSGTMKEAFGVQRQVEVKVIPKGTSIIKQEFSPGRTIPTVLNQVRQLTIDDYRKYLDASDTVEMDTDTSNPGADDGESQGPTEGDGTGSTGDNEGNERGSVGTQGGDKGSQGLSPDAKLMNPDGQRLVAALRAEIKVGSVEVESRGPKIVIRIMEKGAFPAGSAELRPSFEPVLMKIRRNLAHIAGRIIVAGHTDDIPIETQRFRSNWELSTARAVTVAEKILEDGWLQKRRFAVAGYADTRPLERNDSAYHRAKNRRVEIVILQSEGDKSDEVGLTDISSEAFPLENRNHQQNEVYERDVSQFEKDQSKSFSDFELEEAKRKPTVAPESTDQGWFYNLSDSLKKTTRSWWPFGKDEASEQE